ncbi:glucagon receptor-like [Platysternon megacephalum]|uniref:Glucagon receptor-like n=1 Tax=Platysternon megacephalum TaxID=55544 RepID=A0A4D9E4T8_9SAUR|nr:glucagon receptor-like [Platysternon megacephalum]
MVGIVTVIIVCAICILRKDLADDAFVAILEDKLKVEILDLQKGSLFFRISKTVSVKDDSVMAHSKLIIITASAFSKEERVKVFNLVQRNILKCIIFTLSN